MERKGKERKGKERKGKRKREIKGRSQQPVRGCHAFGMCTTALSSLN